MNLSKKNKLYNQIMYEKNLKWLKLDLDFNVDEIWKELKNIEKYKDQSKSGWTGLAYRGISSNKVRPYPTYGYKSEDETPYKWTQVSKNAPLLREELEKHLPNTKFFRIKINKLLPGGKIFPHKDSRKQGLGLTEHWPYSDPDPYKIKYLTLALDWPKDVEFYVSGKRLPITTGDCFLVNFNHLHEVYNRTKHVRTSVIITAELEDQQHWQDLVISSYKKYGDLSKNIKTVSALRYLQIRADAFWNKNVISAK